MAAPFFLVDAFSSDPFAGNPAGVCLLDGPAPEGWMQSLAMEMNQAETAYVYPIDGGFSLRWYTPVKEVDLCGHATLASAHALWTSGTLDKACPAVFHTRSGELRSTLGRDGRITMDFPAEPAEPANVRLEIIEAVGANAIWIGRNRMDYLFELCSEEDVRSLTPDLGALAKEGVRGFIFTAASSVPGIDFVSRFFAPGFGINEDPVTGSAHCCLGPYWASKLGRNELVGYQASRRGGFVGVNVRGERVELSGSALTVVKGEVEVPVR